jgi:hypothetical protein
MLKIVITTLIKIYMNQWARKNALSRIDIKYNLCVWDSRKKTTVVCYTNQMLLELILSIKFLRGLSLFNLPHVTHHQTRSHTFINYLDSFYVSFPFKFTSNRFALTMRQVITLLSWCFFFVTSVSR